MSGITNYDLVADLVRSRVKALRDELQSGVLAGNTLDLKIPHCKVGGTIQDDENNNKLTMEVNITLRVSPKQQ